MLGYVLHVQRQEIRQGIACMLIEKGGLRSALFFKAATGFQLLYYGQTPADERFFNPRMQPSFDSCFLLFPHSIPE